MKKVFFLVGLVLLLFGAIANADSIDDAARAIYNGDLEATEVAKIFSSSEMKKVNEKVKELRLENLKKEKAEEEKEKGNKLLNLIRAKKSKEAKEAKDNILVEDIDKELGKVKSKVSNLETRVTKLEGNTTSKVKKADAKRSTKKTKIDEIAQKIIKGELGDGTERVEKLKKLGYSSKEIAVIQKAVNEEMNKWLSLQHFNGIQHNNPTYTSKKEEIHYLFFSYAYYISFSYSSSSLLLDKLNLKSIRSFIFVKNVLKKLWEYILGRFNISFLALSANE